MKRILPLVLAVASINASAGTIEVEKSQDPFSCHGQFLMVELPVNSTFTVTEEVVFFNGIGNLLRDMKNSSPAYNQEVESLEGCTDEAYCRDRIRFYIPQKNKLLLAAGTTLTLTSISDCTIKGQPTSCYNFSTTKGSSIQVAVKSLSLKKLKSFFEKNKIKNINVGDCPIVTL